MERMTRTRSAIAVVAARREEFAAVRRAAGAAYDVIACEPTAVPGDVALVVVDGVLLRLVLDTRPDTTAGPRIVVLGEGPLDDPRIVHVVPRAVDHATLRPLLHAVLEGHPIASAAPAPPRDQAEARLVQRAFTVSRALATVADLVATERALVAGMASLAAAERVRCLFHDPNDGSLWSEERRLAGADDELRATGGVTGFAARTGLAVATTAADPRCIPALDDPGGASDAHLLVQPFVGVDGHVHAVVIAARDRRRGAFDDGEQAAVAAYARFVAPFLDHLSAHIAAQAVLEESSADPMFREEAVQAQALPRWGDVVRVSPAWVSWAYWVLVAAILASLGYVSVGTVSTYSAGPAIIRSTSRGEVVARSPGIVTEVLVERGAPVASGDPIARLDDTDARSAVSRLEREFDTQLRNHMMDPADLGADAALRTLRLELAEARNALEDRMVRADRAGIVADLRVRRGQRVEAGNIVATILDGSGELEVIALLPGSDRPQLEAGMPLRLELAGYRYAYQTVTIDSVSTDVVGPGEALRVLGPEVADGLHLPPSVVLVHARIPGHEFVVDGEAFRYHDGMLGRAEVRVREERILFALIPGLRGM